MADSDWGDYQVVDPKTKNVTEDTPFAAEPRGASGPPASRLLTPRFHEEPDGSCDRMCHHGRFA